MTYEQIKYEPKEGILTITLNRPDKLNAFTGTMLKELLDAMDKADRDDDVRAIVFTGAGRGFCAGADLSGGANTFNAENRGPDPGLDGHRDGGGLFTLRLYELAEAHDRRLQWASCRGRHHHAARDGRAAGIGDGTLRIRLYAPRHRDGGLLELVPATPRGAAAGA